MWERLRPCRAEDKQIRGEASALVRAGGWAPAPVKESGEGKLREASRMIPRVDFSTVRFEEPQYLWLLVAPAVLLVVWFWQTGRRRGDVHRFAQHRTLPVRERFE